MEEAAARFNKQVTKLGRDVKAWPVWGWLKETIDAFKKTMPLITDLRNPAMRPRHWQQLMEHINTRSAPQGTVATVCRPMPGTEPQQCTQGSTHWASCPAQMGCVVVAGVQRLKATW
jgi:hypothetical protein